MRKQAGPGRRRRRRLSPHPLPSPSRDAGSILPRRKKMRFAPKSCRERKEMGGGNRGEEIGKAYFSSSPAVTPGPPCPLLAASPRRPPLAEPRSLLPGSWRLRGAENTLTLAHTTNFKPAQSMSH